MADNITVNGITFRSKELAGAIHLLLQGLADQAGADAMGLVTASPDPLTLLGRLKAIADALTAESAFVDGLEGLATTNNTLATALNGYVDGVEGLIAATNGYVDGLEPLFTSVRDRLPALLGPQTGATSLSTTPSTDQDPIFDHANAVKVAVGAAAGAVITPPAGCKYLRIHATVDCFVRTDAADPADAAGSIKLLANAPEVIPVVAGVIVKSIRATADGTIYATPMKVR